jgi:hypothetical protein
MSKRARVLSILRLIVLLATIVAGAASTLAPSSITGFTGLVPAGPRGISEIRAILGGVFVALGIAPLLLRSRDAYRTVGIVYLGVAIVRAVSILVDSAPMPSNLISLAFEVVAGVILLL